MKVLLILVDGMRPDSLAGKPAAEAILTRSRSTLRARTVMPSVTLPCHMSLFHSVEPSRHGTTTNVYTLQVRPIRGLCEVLRAAGRKCAFFYDWEELRDLTRPDSLVRSCFCSGHQLGYEKADALIEREAIACLREDETDFLFLYIGNVDEVGHRYGWMSPEYHAAVAAAWDEITRVLEAAGDGYTVLITADHGGHEQMHGYDVPEDMTTPLLILQKGLTPGTLPDGISITDLAPTVAKLLGAAPDPDWEGKSIL